MKWTINIYDSGKDLPEPMPYWRWVIRNSAGDTLGASHKAWPKRATCLENLENLLGESFPGPLVTGSPMPKGELNWKVDRDR